MKFIMEKKLLKFEVSQISADFVLTLEKKV